MNRVSRFLFRQFDTSLKLKLLLVGLPIFLLIVLLVATPTAHAAESYTAEAAFDAPNTGGAPTEYRFYTGCDAPGSRQLLASTETGQAEATVAGGKHFLCVTAVNSKGEGPIGEIAELDVGAAVPGAVRNLQISIPCAVAGGCSATIIIHPAAQ